MRKKITFRADSEQQERLYAPPAPAVRGLPQWYKKMPLRTGVHNDGFDMDRRSNKPDFDLTAKACIPLFDAMSLGYQIVLPFDVALRTSGVGEMAWAWHWPSNLIEEHSLLQVQGMPDPVEGTKSSTPFKWVLGWDISVPPGYSILYTHPLNRWDLPFRTFSGVVDDDIYPQAVQFPFQLVVELAPNSELVIHAGTPIVQFFPFKREDWASEVLPFDERLHQKGRFDVRKNWWRGYKHKMWQRKSFK